MPSAHCESLFSYPALPLSDALESQYLHDLGISHRDIKPENILLKLNTASLPRVLLTDFGAAHCTRWQQGHGDQQVAAAIKRCSSWVGTNGYMSPEILRVIAKHQQMALGKMQRGVPEQEQERQKEEEIVYDGFKADCFALGGESRRELAIQR